MLANSLREGLKANDEFEDEIANKTLVMIADVDLSFNKHKKLRKTPKTFTVQIFIQQRMLLMKQKKMLPGEHRSKRDRSQNWFYFSHWTHSKKNSVNIEWCEARRNKS